MTETTTFEAKFIEAVDAAQSFSITNTTELEEFRVKFLGVKGVLKDLFHELKQSDASDRKLYGEFIGKFKDISELKYSSFKDIFIPPNGL